MNIHSMKTGHRRKFSEQTVTTSTHFSNHTANVSSMDTSNVKWL